MLFAKAAGEAAVYRKPTLAASVAQTQVAAKQLLTVAGDLAK